jgi:DNA replication protein DnaC
MAGFIGEQIRQTATEIGRPIPEPEAPEPVAPTTVQPKGPPPEQPPPMPPAEREFDRATERWVRAKAAQRTEHHAAMKAYWDRLNKGAEAEPPSEESFACADCRDLHFVRLPVPEGHPDWGRAKPCPSCSLERNREDLARVAGLRGHDLQQTFASFKAVAGSERALKATRAFADNPSGLLLVHGVPGAGKSHLAFAVANALIERNVHCRVWYGADLEAEAKSRIGQDDIGGPTAFIKEVQDTDVLIIDDLGTIRDTAFGLANVIEPIIAARYRADRPTLVTALSAPRDIREKFSASIGRRFEDRERAQAVHLACEQYGGNA